MDLLFRERDEHYLLYGIERILSGVGGGADDGEFDWFLGLFLPFLVPFLCPCFPFPLPFFPCFSFRSLHPDMSCFMR
jgi:hypothetical protein